MELSSHSRELGALKRVEGLGPSDEARSAPVPMDPTWARWQAQPWRRQLRHFEDSTRRLDRRLLVRWLVREGLTPAAELAWLAGHIEEEASPDTLTIQQVVRFADSLTEHVANASPTELIHTTFLQRNAVGLANRMIEWVNAGRL